MPGKTLPFAVDTTLDGLASMRPQRNAGENRIHLPFPWQVLQASMRPQRNAGENLPVAVTLALREFASMRPQRNAGENRPSTRICCFSNSCFNEAPAKCRGKHGCGERAPNGNPRASMRPQRNAGENHTMPMPQFHGIDASMRPQRNAGENPCSCAGLPVCGTCFNEAPAKCRGKHAEGLELIGAVAKLQ